MTLVCSAVFTRAGSPAFAASPCSPSGTAQTQPPAASETVVLPTFSVSTSLDRATAPAIRCRPPASTRRSRTCVHAQRVHDQFINDIGARELPDIAVFAPGVTSARRSSWRATPFLHPRLRRRHPTAAQRFRRHRYVDTANVVPRRGGEGPGLAALRTDHTRRHHQLHHEAPRGEGVQPASGPRPAPIRIPAWWWTTTSRSACGSAPGWSPLRERPRVGRDRRQQVLAPRAVRGGQAHAHRLAGPSTTSGRTATRNPCSA